MSFIKQSKKAYSQVKENHIAIAMGNMLDDEGSMILNQLQELERGIEMLRAYVGKDYEKQLPAWVQSKVTLATDYISTVGNYLSSKNEKVTEETIKESFELTETTFEKIYQMQQDGKSLEDIAKELKLNSALVKKVLGESKTISEGLSDAQIAQLKKEYGSLKNKTITVSQYQQLKNLLFKLHDGDLEKLQKQNIPFASTGAASILRVRKAPVKITNVTVPGLEGMAEETTFWWHDGKTGYVKAGYDNKELLAWLKKNGYKPEKDIKEEVEIQEEPKKEKADKDNEDIATWFRSPAGVAWLKKNQKPRKKIKEESELKPVPSLEDSAKKHNVDIETLKKQLEKGIEIEKEHTKDEKVAEKIALAHIDERPDYYVQIDKLEKKPVEKVAEVKEPTGDLKDACWTGYVAIGTKMKNGKRVPNCVPKSEAYKGARAIVENAFKKLKEKK
jgi:hypothetical protein